MPTHLKNATWEDSFTEKLNYLQSIGLHRELYPVENATQPYLTCDGKTMLNLSSNNYLGIANHPYIIQGMQDVANSAGMASSRLVIGHDPHTQELEKAIALHKSTESALLFSSGYMMNVGALSSLLDSTDIVLGDQYNHASIIDGIRLSNATHLRYRHNNLNHLETLLKKATVKGVKRILIATETVFSMDGDIAPLADIVFLKNKYGAALFTDDAHGDGVFGTQGEGTVHHMGLENDIDLHTGTFSKAYGVYGAYVAGNKKWIEYLIHTCRSLIYTTALPPSVVHGIHKAMDLVKEGHHLRKRLEEKSLYFRTGLKSAGFQVVGTTQIIPLIVGNEVATITLSKKLSKENILAVAIRPPTVTKGSSRIRFTIMANHSWESLNKALKTITSIGKEMGIIE